MYKLNIETADVEQTFIVFQPQIYDSYTSAPFLLSLSFFFTKFIGTNSDLQS